MLPHTIALTVLSVLVFASLTGTSSNPSTLNLAPHDTAPKKSTQILVCPSPSPPLPSLSQCILGRGGPRY